MSLKIGVLGTGKTGSEIVKILQTKPQFTVVEFNRAHPPTAENWAAVDAAICFLPGPAFLEYLDVFLKNPKPMIVGSTGYELTTAQNDQIRALSCPWVISSNFSIGMSLAKGVIAQMSRWAAGSNLKISQSIDETHHVHKKDAPSGTALLWKRWADDAATMVTSAGQGKSPITITSHRVEDQAGTHEYKLTLPREIMTFTHDATSRAVFAEGAVWALEEILTHPTSGGRQDFFALIEQSIGRGKTS